MGEAGRPRVYIPDKVADDLMEYVNKTEDPMIEEFCIAEGNPSKDTLYRLEKENCRISDAIKKCHLKQEIRTVKRVEIGLMNPTWAIFKMKQKQYGWTDKQELEHSGEIQMPTIKITK